MPMFRGKPACACLVAWLPVFEAELKRRSVIRSSLDIYQLIGGAPASGGTHTKGGAFDVAQRDAVSVKVAREMGAAFWNRPVNWDNRGGMAHGHGVLNGCPHNAPARYQIADLAKGLNGLANHGKDNGPEPRKLRTWEQGIKWAEAQAKAAKPPVEVKPWFNVAFLNTWGNDDEKGAKTAATRGTTMVRDATAGDPAIVGFCEVRSGAQETELTSLMATEGYVRVAYTHMLAMYARKHVVIRGVSFAKYKKQRGGTVEGILRGKFTIDGSKCQVGITHLDAYATEAIRRTTLKEAYYAMRRFGIATLLPDWKSRTAIMGDFNSPTAVQVLEDLGFKDAGAGAHIDFITVGAKRKMRGASKVKTTSDHPVVKAKLGRA